MSTLFRLARLAAFMAALVVALMWLGFGSPPPMDMYGAPAQSHETEPLVENDPPLQNPTPQDPAPATGPDKNAAQATPSKTAEPEYRLHTVAKGETLWDIVTREGLDVADVVEINNLADPSFLKAGQVLKLPAAGFPRDEETKAVASAAPSPGWLWPVTGTISSRFGTRWGRQHTGIDIAAPTGTPIHAARDGTVEHAGFLGNYGRTVVLRHSDGSRSLYAHASSVLVKKGAKVKRGDVIAKVGSSGRSTGPHLHWEIIIQGRPRDPLKYARPGD